MGGGIVPDLGFLVVGAVEQPDPGSQYPDPASGSLPPSIRKKKKDCWPARREPSHGNGKSDTGPELVWRGVASSDFECHQS